MSGVGEASLVLGVISSTIAIVDGIWKVYDAANDAQGLPKAFRDAAARLPDILDTLSAAKRRIEDSNAPDSSYRGAQNIATRCEINAEELKVIFEKVIPADGASRGRRYLTAVRTLGKGSSVESLMKTMLEDVQLLAANYSMSLDLSKVIGKAVKDTVTLPGDPSNACLSAMLKTLRTDPRDDRAKIAQLKGDRIDGTCEWIKEDALYKKYLQPSSNLLWVSGGPGKGKTMLSIFLAEEFERKARASRDVAALEFFCDNKDEGRNTADKIVTGLLYQLLQMKPQLEVHILPAFKIQQQALFAATSADTLWRILEAIIHDPELGKVYCVLDGLDECDAATAETFIRRLTKLSLSSRSSPACQFHAIIVSRDSPDFLPSILKNVPRIKLDPDKTTEVSRDINKFVDTKVNELAARKSYSAKLCNHVKRVFLDRAKGTFLWVGIVAKQLEKYKATEVEDALNLFPTGLDEVYTRLLFQIEPHRRQVAARILRWVIFAVRPLTVQELGAAMEISATKYLDMDEITKDQVSFCGYFVSINEDVVNLIHQSVKDYFLGNIPCQSSELDLFNFSSEVVNHELTSRCLHYLQNSQFKDRVVDLGKDIECLKNSPLLSYATLHWLEHARNSGRTNDIFDLSLPFWEEGSSSRGNWLSTFLQHGRRSPYAEPEQQRRFNLLHIAAYFGLIALVEKLLPKATTAGTSSLLNRDNSEIEAKGPYGQTALLIAINRHHEDVSKYLIERGADVDAYDEVGRSALYLACRRGQTAVVNLLLDHGANIEIGRAPRGTPLCAASSEGRTEIVRLLLSRGAKIEAKDYWGMAALVHAVVSTHIETVVLLLDYGADIETCSRYGGTALVTASYSGYKELVQLLLDRGANIEASPSYSGHTALMKASQRGHADIVSLLASRGANVQAQDRNGETALHHAAEYSFRAMQDDRSEVITLLLAKGANIHAQDQEGDTALHLAAYRGRRMIVQLLLKNGADVEVRRKDGATPLHCATMKFKFYETRYDEIGIVQLLITEGADIHARNCNEETALHLAAYRGQKLVVQLLLLNGADTFARRKDGATPLECATMQLGEKEKREDEAGVVQLLTSHATSITPSRPSESQGLARR